MDKKQYKRFADAHAPKSPIFRNCIFAFIFGGAICCFGEALSSLYSLHPSIDQASARTLTSVTLIFIAVLLTGLGVFDKIAKVAGAGTLVPITGFANSVASPAIDSRSEGYVLGVGAKIFTVCGPVLLYGTLAGAIYGVIYWICGLI
ncbi:MAG: stage V sporulation protein AC [Ruminococcaceae bacterium]|nr:stage V sporulation protein AC [Oscillospiraceae bacterium]